MGILTTGKVEKVKNQPMISVFCQVYNTREKYLRMCIDSVLGQTFQNFEFHIVDNGSTDQTKNILEEYARKDERIQLFRIEKNDISRWHYYDIYEKIRGKYGAVIDSDDWWEPMYLERLLCMAEESKLDIVCTGCVFHEEKNGRTGKRQMKSELVLGREDYGLYYSVYHVFFRTMWGKIFKTELVSEVCAAQGKLVYGLDTVMGFQWLEKSRRMGISPTAMYHYRVYSESASYKYHQNRFASDVYLYEDAVRFLRNFGKITKRNQEFLYQVYANAVRDTVKVIARSALSSLEKREEYIKIALHPLSEEAFRCTEDACRKCRELLAKELYQVFVRTGTENDETAERVRRAFENLLPECAKAAENEILDVLRRENVKEYFLQDNKNGLVNELLQCVKDGSRMERKRIFSVLRKLIKGDPLMERINASGFPLWYAELYQLIWKREYMQALDEMTGLLLEEKAEKEMESFLEFYLTLAALEGEESAYLFGKVRLARLLCRKKDLAQAEQVYQELLGYGLGENEEVQEIGSILQGKTEGSVIFPAETSDKV